MTVTPSPVLTLASPLQVDTYSTPHRPVTPSSRPDDLTPVSLQSLVRRQLLFIFKEYCHRGSVGVPFI